MVVLYLESLRAAGYMSSKHRVHFSLRKKVEVIEEAKKNKTLTCKALGERFGCGKMQIGCILKNQDTILAQHYCARIVS